MRRPFSNLWWAVGACAAVTGVCVVVAALLAGGRGAAGAFVGGLLGLVFFASSPAILGAVMKRWVSASLPIALLLYFVKALAASAIVVVLVNPQQGGRWLHLLAFAAAMVAVTLARVSAHVTVLSRSRVASFDLDEGR